MNMCSRTVRPILNYYFYVNEYNEMMMSNNVLWKEVNECEMHDRLVFVNKIIISTFVVRSKQYKYKYELHKNETSMK